VEPVAMLAATAEPVAMPEVRVAKPEEWAVLALQGAQEALAASAGLLGVLAAPEALRAVLAATD